MRKRMTITLITLTNKKLNLGVRHLSTYLKLHGHNTQIIFLKPDDAGRTWQVTPALAEQIRDISRDSTMYGISLFTLDYPLAADLTELLRSVDTKPIIWGGVHTMLEPDTCIQHADYVCIDEGERVLVQLLTGMEKGGDINHIPGLWVRDHEKTVTNPVNTLHHNLDDYGIPDFTTEAKWVNDNGTLRPLNVEYMRQSGQMFGACHFQEILSEKAYMYTIMTSRGCPHRCSYCSNTYYLDVYKGKGRRVRWRTIQHVITELTEAIRQYPFINAINFYDDDFMARPRHDLSLFRDLYREKINLPFACMASPWSFQSDKLDILIDAGLVHLQMGIQSGSERINYEVYNRKVKNAKSVRHIQTLDAYRRKGLLRNYVIDMIFDNPYETPDDQFDTLQFFSQLPRYVRLQFFSLVFYPHTPLTERAIRDGLISEDEIANGKMMSKWLNLTIKNYTFYEFMIEFHKFIPHRLFRLLVKRPIFKLFRIPVFNGLFLMAHQFKNTLNRLVAWLELA